MWNNPRPVRSEVISINAPRLAQIAADKMGFTGILAVSTDGRTKLSICQMAGTKLAADRLTFWFKNARCATDVLDEVALLEAVPWTAVCIDGAVLVDTPLDGIERVIALAQRWTKSYARCVPQAAIDAHLASVEQQIQRSLLRMQATGHMATLNRQYKALRAQPRAEGEKAPPSYKIWATKQLEQAVLGLL